MRRSRLFCETLRQAPADIDSAGHQWLIRGGFVQPLAAGIFTFLPLGQRVASKIEQIMREEMNAIGGQELTMPVVHPAELWQETGRWQAIGPEMARFQDRGDRPMVLGMTHEEVIADLLRRQVKSYRQLPVMLYQIQTKFRDEPRARGGLLRTREFVMKDLYSAHASFDDIDRFYPLAYQAYFNIFRRAGIEVSAVESDTGMMGGTQAHEFMFLNEIGEDQLVLCDNCGYSANRQVATFRKDAPAPEAPAPLEEVATPGTQTIAALAALLNVPASRTAKAAFFMADDRFIFAVVRGDMEVNETKLANAVGASELRPARPEDLERTGMVAGYASPIGVSGVTVVVDDLVAQSPNLVAGANRVGYHLLNTNYGRDWNADVVADIVAADTGAPCPRCGAPVRMVRGVEVGNIFKLGTKYTEALGATFLDEHGASHHIVMGSYGIGVGRLMGCLAQGCRDEQGLRWPVSVAPYHVYLVGLDLADDTIRTSAEALYAALEAAGVDVLFDDRDERAGVKFKDADLLGLPIRITISRRTMQNSVVEFKPRADADARQIALDAAVSETVEVLNALRGALAATLKDERIGE